MNALRSTAWCLAGLVLLGIGLDLRAQDAGDEPAQAQGVRGMIERHLAECDDPQAKAEVQRLLFSLFPEELRHAEQVLARNREEAEEVVGMLINQSWRLMDMRHDQPERFEEEVRMRELNNQTVLLGRQVAAATGEKRAALTKQLQTKLAEYFEAKQARMKQDAERMKAELQRMEDQIRRREERRDSLLERRLQQLVEGEVEW